MQKVSALFQVPIDPIGKLPGLLDALKLMDAAVQQNMYHEKLLMYRNVRMPDQDKVLVCAQIVPEGHCLAELPVGLLHVELCDSSHHAALHRVPHLHICVHVCTTAELKLVRMLDTLPDCLLHQQWKHVK